MFIRPLSAFVNWLSGQPNRRIQFLPRVRRLAVPNALERLEERVLLTPNFAINAVHLVDKLGGILTRLSPGEQVYVRGDYITTDLPAKASYDVSFTVNGFTLNSGPITWGAGLVGTNVWPLNSGPFVLTPGSNQITVTGNPDHLITENNYFDNAMTITVNTTFPAVGPSSYSVAQIRSAYGLNNLANFGSTTADGTGQTIAIVAAFNAPNIFSDLDQFDQSMNLSSNFSPTLFQKYGAASSLLTVYNQYAVNISPIIANSNNGDVPPLDPTGAWERQITLDVEWAHAIAPGAKIDLIECEGTDEFAGLFEGVTTAASLPGVSVVSMSWNYPEADWAISKGAGELALDSLFVTPTGHSGITFLASSGDSGVSGGYPASSPNVVAVGATELTTNGYAYQNEIAWSFGPPRTINNGSTSYIQTGVWSTKSGGFSGINSTAKAAGDNSASWTTQLSPSDLGSNGGVEVSATWVPETGNATNAIYRIYDGDPVAKNYLGMATVNQSKAPAGTPVGKTQFQDLGTYFPTSGRITVVLSNDSANGTVSADAVGIAPAWATGGGRSVYEKEPAYQTGFQSSGFRATPDVSFDGSINSGVTTWQNGPGYDNFGTGIACPSWAGIMAIVEQGRASLGANPLNSATDPTEALRAIYNLPARDFNDVTTGYNGQFAGTGYDASTGRGTPIANLLIPDLVLADVKVGLNFTVEPATTILAGSPIKVAVTAEYPNGNVDAAYTGPVTLSIATEPGSAALNGTLTVNAVNGVASFSPNITVVGSGYSLKATAGGLIPATSSQFSITATKPTIVVTDAGGIYNGRPFPATATVTGIGGVKVNGTTTFKYYVGNTVTGTGSSIAPTNVGTYTVVGTFTSSNPGYVNASSSPVTFVIQKATPAVVAIDAGGTYNGKAFPASTHVTVSGATFFRYYVGGSVSGTGSLIAPTNVGTYTVVAVFTSRNPNYSNATSAPVTFAINPVSGFAGKLVFVSVPNKGSLSAVLSAPVTVAIEDQSGNILTGITSAVTLTIASGPVGGAFSTGTSLTATPVNGVAAFSNLKFTKAGTYTLKARFGTSTFVISGYVVIS